MTGTRTIQTAIINKPYMHMLFAFVYYTHAVWKKKCFCLNGHTILSRAEETRYHDC